MSETAVAAGTPQKLDDIMIAMDVVDTLRHREDLVRRELGEEQREAELIARLRKIYQDQGIEVPDRVLADGVKALKESRFVYTPPPAGWKRDAADAVGPARHGRQARRCAACAHRRGLDGLLRAGHASGATGRGARAHRDHRDAAPRIAPGPRRRARRGEPTRRPRRRPTLCWPTASG